MAAYLITHSLLSSWLHLIRENPYEDLTTEGDPLAEFMLVLRREPTPRTEAMQNGIDFENLVTAIVNGHDVKNRRVYWYVLSLCVMQDTAKNRKNVRNRFSRKSCSIPFTMCFNLFTKIQHMFLRNALDFCCLEIRHQITPY